MAPSLPLWELCKDGEVDEVSLKTDELSISIIVIQMIEVLNITINIVIFSLPPSSSLTLMFSGGSTFGQV